MKVSYKDVNECCIEMSEIVTKMNNSVSEIKSSAEKLQKGLWNSPASDNYCIKLINLTSSFESITNRISKSLISINKSMENYKEIDKLITGGSKSITPAGGRRDLVNNHVIQ